ncbi:MAG: class I SAM-dependent methyltransferase family protein [Candidatus Methanomethyliaceae archaeon]|nr:class I SAM-dependent methyltransferase family protein [Candidatus Methanomethyliaceae archaeon]
MRERIVREALSRIFPQQELDRAISTVDMIGDLAVIKIPREWEEKRFEIGEILLSSLKGVEGVFRQTTPADDEYKVRGLEWLAGKRDTITLHREHGCYFRVDISTVYFSPRLSFERLRIARLTRKGEILVNMFAGVGTFSIMSVMKGGAERVFSIDKNPAAFKFMMENVILNKVSGKVIPILGDAKEVSNDLQGVADRVLMPLPALATQYLPYAVSCLRGRGWVHVYLHEKGRRRDVVSSGVDTVKKALKERVISASGRVVRSVGRETYQIVVDVEVSP